jgi:ligand-binding sensor domain-containing protein/serine phosphatase RsbU (regulator of sigma subunit)
LAFTFFVNLKSLMLTKNTYTTKWFIVVLIFFISSLSSFSQNIKFKRINIDDGLSQASIKTILQDSDGFIWIGTQDGLNRYDGFHMKIFKNDYYDTLSLPSNDINYLFEGKNGVIYVGTNDGGFSVYNKSTEKFTNYKKEKSSNALSDNSVRGILEINDNELLIATNEGLNLFDKKNKQFTRINYFNKPLKDIKCLYKTSTNRLFIGTFGNGLFELKDNKKNLDSIPLPPSFITTDVDNDKFKVRTLVEVDGNLWCGTEKGILIFNLKDNLFKSEIKFSSSSKYNNRIVDFSKESNSDFIWIGTWAGLIKYNISSGLFQTTLNNPLDQNSISDNYISCLFSDNQKNLWIGTNNKGLNIYFPNSLKFPLYNSQSGLTNDYVYSIVQTADKTIWVGTDEGLFLKKEKDLNFTEAKDLNAKHKIKGVLSLLETKNGKLWIGTYGQGIIIYDSKTNKSETISGTSQKTSNQNSVGGTVTKMIESKNGNIWVATYGDGLFSINPNNLNTRRFTSKQGLSSDDIYFVYENVTDNTLWLGTDDGGVCVLDFIHSVDKPFITTYKHADAKNSISSNLVNSIYKDTKGIFWIATNNGLNRFDTKKKEFLVYTEKDGLPNNYVYDVIPDKNNNLWLPSNLGLSKFNTSMDNENGSAFKNYSTKDGIQAREFNQGASFLCEDGKIIVGGISGLNYFDPAELKENKITPNSFIYSIKRQGKEIITDSSIVYKKHLEFPYKENYFTFELIALDYASPEKIKFMYKLEGKDNEWSTPSDLRYVSYTELSGGTYVFKVKATNSDGIWNETPFEITIKIIPPWYMTTWFYITAGLLIFGLIFGISTYRTNLVKKENKRLENKVNERTRELAEKNKDITSSIEYAKRIQEAILPSQDLIFSKLKNAFILYKPKDIVSGDFYWFGEKDNTIIMAAVDCTGHGVPGAFMSMIGHNLLNQIVSEKGHYDPGTILQELHKGVQAALKQGQNQIKTNDGMDVSIAAINLETMECAWAGAYRSLIIINNKGELEKIEGNKYAIGGAQLDKERIFTTHVRSLAKGDTIYLFSDGYADQFGGEKGKKFMVKKFYQNLTDIHHLTANEQNNLLDKQFTDWKSNYEQVDDVLVIGVKM